MQILDAKLHIAVCKRYIAFFKRQLPQQRPETALRRCPFCGGKAAVKSESFTNYVICQRCNAATGFSFSNNANKAIAKWNKRK